MQESNDNYGIEVVEPHTRLLRIALVIEESRSYWQCFRPSIPEPQRTTVAFEERWFGNRSMERVKTLLSCFSQRFDAYPAALEVLRFWKPADPITRALICHWHTQLTDPIYRSFTGNFLEQRRFLPTPDIDRDIVGRWVAEHRGRDWAPATTIKMATSLLTCAASAGLCSGGVGSRSLKYPKVSDYALAYWLYFLKHLTFEGSLLENPYLASVGLSEHFLEQRVKKLPGVSFYRMGELSEFRWEYPNLLSWAKETLVGELKESL
jgi:hypothetical protein